MLHVFIYGTAFGLVVKEALVFVIRRWARFTRREPSMTREARVIYLTTRQPPPRKAGRS